MASNLTITGPLSDEGAATTSTWLSPSQQLSILDQTKSNYPRSLIMSNDGVRIMRPDYSMGFNWIDLIKLAVTRQVNLTWYPAFGKQPVATTVTHTATAYFTVASAAWSSGAAYTVGQTVTSSSVEYICTVAVGPSATAPASDTTHWSAWNAGLESISGLSATYQWQFIAAAGNTWANVTDGAGPSGCTFSNSATQTLSISTTAVALTGYQFRCVATTAYSGASGQTNTSSAAILTVN
jgi:hypothetical protein